MRRLVSIAIALLTFGALACTQADAPRVDHVVLVSIDSLRADHVGALGYPRNTTPTIDRLSRQGSVFTRAYSTTSWTLPAHAALFSGLDDAASGVETPRQALAPEIETLAERLRAQGVRTTGFWSGPYLHPAFGLSQGFEHWENCTSHTPGDGTTSGARQTLVSSLRDVTNPVLLERVSEWSRGVDPGERQFVFVHMWDVHFDYIAPSSYVATFDADYAGDLEMAGFIDNPRIAADMAPRDLEHVIAQYDAEVRYTDETLGWILEQLDAAGILENAAVIVVADHGDEFFEHGGKGHKKTLFEEVLRVPLVMRIAGYTPVVSRVDAIVSLVDVAPTICALFGESCEGGSGASLLPLLAGGGDGARKVWRGDALAELHDSPTGPQAALVDADGKAVRWTEPGVTMFYRPEDLADERRAVRVEIRDPARLAEHAPTAARLLEREAAARTARRERPGSPAPAPDAATRDQLRSLGYEE